MPDPNYKALCAELINHLQVRVSNEDREIPTVGYYSQSQQLLDRARASLAQTGPQGPTDEELQRRFLVWWHDEGSGMLPLPGRDYEEHARRISEIAWANGAYVARWGRPTSQEDYE